MSKLFRNWHNVFYMGIMVSTNCHFLQKATEDHARASSHCTCSFFNVARYVIPVVRDAISVSHEGGNLHLGSTVSLHPR